MKFKSNSSLLDYEIGEENEHDFLSENSKDLKTSKKLDFLKEEKFDNISDSKYWSLYENGKKIEPLKFSNGKTQEDVVKEIVGLINKGTKIIFLHGVCGTGKSAIALNVARTLGRASIIVPIKSLQRQYEEEYMGKKYVIKSSGKKMKIAMITGRENHDSIIIPGVSCADPYLPDTIKIVEKNYSKLRQYYIDNPFISEKRIIPSENKMRRISVAPANPHWSPILPADIELSQLKDAKKIKYKGINDREFIFYHRKSGCSYYDQYLSYANADVIISNSAKYMAEMHLGRKPETDVEIIDEADEFLDSLSTQTEINLTRLASSLQTLSSDSDRVKAPIKKICELIDLEETNKRALGINEKDVFSLKDTKILEILKELSNNPYLEADIEIDEMNYANTALQAARDFSTSLSNTFLTYRKEENDLFATLVTTELSGKFAGIANSNKALVLMSGTLHSENVLKHIFGIENYAFVEAETITQGAIEVHMTGKEMDCTYSRMQAVGSREKYLKSLNECVAKAKKPLLVHVNAFSDLPSEQEIDQFSLRELISKDKLKSLQKEDKTGKLVSLFKSGLSDKLFSTKCSRGIDFPGETCNSIIFTKYPNPNVKDTFWIILQKTHQEHYWEFYTDKARREFLQRIYRAVRSKNDHVYILSPDIRVIKSVRELWK